MRQDLREILGTEYPIIQGGMANIATAEFAAAVSQAGGLGLIASGGYSCDEIRDGIKRLRAITDKPFGVNIMLMHPQADEIAEMVIEEKVPVITTGAGNPGKYIASWKEAGIKVLPVVPSVALARRMEKAGADALIVEGTEAGGHIGEITTMALVPQIIAAVELPVVAAGGVASGEQMLAAYALGACGVQIGTVLLAADECPIHESYKDAIIKAKDTDTTVTGRISGVPVRVLKNKMAREYVKLEREGADAEELEKYTLGSLRKAVYDGDTSNGSLMAGQVAGQVCEKKPVAQILNELMTGCREAQEDLAKLKL